jgi:hypothetical protein
VDLVIEINQNNTQTELKMNTVKYFRRKNAVSERQEIPWKLLVY